MDEGPAATGGDATARIFGSHLILSSSDPAADRAFCRDVLDLPWVRDTTIESEDWLLFALPPAELAFHPGGTVREHAGAALAAGVLYLMCSDLDAVIETLHTSGVSCPTPAVAAWGRYTSVPLPSGASLGLYEPRHPTAL